MTIQIIKMFDVHVWDGGERQNYAASFSSEEEAKKFASKHDYISPKEIIVFDNVEEAKDFKNGAVKKQALAKLTDAERKALGF